FVLLGDMPQQAKNMGFKKQNALFGCQLCLIPSKIYCDIDYNTISNGLLPHKLIFYYTTIKFYTNAQVTTIGRYYEVCK
ncbi:hypothetical protein L873DRAFT_1665777, partial [Choiromyces venosus 120613-1]